MSEAKTAAQPPSLEAVRQRIDALDTELLRLVDERASLARVVADAKRAAGDGDKFGLRPAREAAILRRLIRSDRQAASPSLIVRIWRELIGDSLAGQGPFHISVWGGKDPGRTVELARSRFGAAPPLAQVARPEDAVAAARTLGGVAVCALANDSAWWGRLLAEPKLKVFATLPCLAAWGPVSALAVAAVDVEPTGDDITLWVTDAAGPAAAVEEALSKDGVAAELLVEAGGLKLFGLAGFYQADDARLARAPGRLSGVIGAAPGLLDV
ncbi:chorismate mutase [Phenylobacterium sp.]|uniref:chorismate mutase n=1 Tax=Phenylobacterium sp. TaxID=1871053 RepID=UPI0025D6FCB8|nr:chorismate mutase [Phenylobacterium sp.]MBX3483302.1 chorismate mutase [Phenylobacterium sp.]MCW5760507.1 chorismate mutase [Phenylobacterium sp.]